MFTPSARAAFHRLAARAHERAARAAAAPEVAWNSAAEAHRDAKATRAAERTDEAWSASFGPDGDRSCGAHGEEQEAAADAAEASQMGRHWSAAGAHRMAANWAKAGRA